MVSDAPIKPGDWALFGETRMTDKQRRLLNAACHDLAEQIDWHGNRLTKDDFRHLLSGTMLGWRTITGIDIGDNRPGLVMLGGSSLDLSKSQATEAITMAFWIGDDPAQQRLQSPRVTWCDVVQLARGIREYEDAA